MISKCKRNFVYRIALVLSLICSGFFCKAQGAAPYPLFLKKAYFGVDVGSLNYPFSNRNLPTGYSAQLVEVPHTAVRLTLFGYHFTKNLSVRITYMRPVQWVLYKNLNGDQSKHSVWMNIAGLTLKQNIFISKKLSLYAESGLALITRNGFDVNNIPVISDADYSTISLGGGIEYHLNQKWDLNVYTSYCHGKTKINQPQTVFAGAGFSYNMNLRQTSNEESKMFPQQMLQFALTTNFLGYSVNHFFAEEKIPVFWGGLVRVEEGWALNYLRNVFHTKKTFSLDVGTSIGNWESLAKDQGFFSLSIYPLMRFNIVRIKSCDYYFFYSVAGPTYLSHERIDDYNTGKHFTFRDFMGIGSFIGQKKILNTEISIGHFSNGNLFPDNAAVKIPLTFSLGYVF